MSIVLAVAGSALAESVVDGTPNPKIYKITLAYSSKIRGNQPARGDYEVAVDAASVRVVEVNTGTLFEVAARIGVAKKQFEGAAITTQKMDGTAEIREIRPGGSKIHIDFR